MTNKDKQLLLQDLCARLPYKQKVYYKIHYNSEEIAETLSGGLLDYFKTGKIAVVKPFLRPMESMTEEEKSLFLDLRNALTYQENGEYDLDDFNELQDFLNRNHLDYRGLIEMGLAIEAPEGMYND